MLDELKKPLEELLSTVKDTVQNAERTDEKSNVFFEKLSEKVSLFSGHATVENKELKYNKAYDPEEQKE